MTDLFAQLTAYLARLWGEPVLVRDLHRIPGGASRETYRFDAEVGGTSRRLILRRDPTGSLLATDREVEFLAYRTAARAGLPVPEPVALERHGAELGRPFFLMERIDGGVVPSPFSARPFGDRAAVMGEAFFRALGRLHAIEPAGTPLGDLLPAPTPEDCWRVQLDYWAAVVERDAIDPQPIALAAIRRLRAHPPPAQAVRIVHGDYRSGNIIHDGTGGLLAVLDWEMAHLGDPLEDLAWAFDPVWDHGEPGRACGMLPHDEAIRLWEAASGLAVDPAALAWWRLFSAVKGRAIWLTALKEYAAGGCTDPVLGISGWYVGRRHDLVLAEQLQAFAEARA